MTSDHYIKPHAIIQLPLFSWARKKRSMNIAGEDWTLAADNPLGEKEYAVYTAACYLLYQKQEVTATAKEIASLLSSKRITAVRKALRTIACCRYRFENCLEKGKTIETPLLNIEEKKRGRGIIFRISHPEPMQKAISKKKYQVFSWGSWEKIEAAPAKRLWEFLEKRSRSGTFQIRDEKLVFWLPSLACSEAAKRRTLEKAISGLSAAGWTAERVTTFRRYRNNPAEGESVNGANLSLGLRPLDTVSVIPSSNNLPEEGRDQLEKRKDEALAYLISQCSFSFQGQVDGFRAALLRDTEPEAWETYYPAWRGWWEKLGKGQRNSVVRTTTEKFILFCFKTQSKSYFKKSEAKQASSRADHDRQLAKAVLNETEAKAKKMAEADAKLDAAIQAKGDSLDKAEILATASEKAEASPAFATFPRMVVRQETFQAVKTALGLEGNGFSIQAMNRTIAWLMKGEKKCGLA